MEIDLSAARATVQELADALAELHGEAIDEAPTRAAQRQRTRVSRELQRAAHLANKASVQIMDTFVDFRDHDLSRRDRDTE